MTRIDEIYFNIFKKYTDKNVPLTRLFFCDPPGTTDPENLMNYGHDTEEHNYIFFHDQEPVFLDIHKNLFDDVVRRNKDIQDVSRNNGKAIVHSEYNSEFIRGVSEEYGWNAYYYFFHGWAALDWFRGYNCSYLIDDPHDRKIKSSYIAPNRIIAGKRDHRVLLFYNLVKNEINTAKISMPKICPYENKPINTIAEKYEDQYPDITSVISNCELPWNFDGESDHPMESCWLGLFDECNESLAYIVTETVFSGKRNHLTEKSFKPICMQMPFILLSTVGSLEYLRSYGFLTFSEFWNEDYDYEENDLKRIEKVSKIASDLDNLSEKELAQLYKHMIPTLKHNHNHFYNGGFQNILWKELTSMLEQIKRDFVND